METLQALASRRSIRSYTGEPLEQDKLDQILAAAQSAPVGMGKYEDYHLTVITNRTLLDEIDANAAPRFSNHSSHPLYNAPVLVVVSSSETGNVASASVGMIIHNMALAAVDLGVGHVDIYGAVMMFNEAPELLAKLQLPEGFVAFGAIALGASDEAYELRTPRQRMQVAYL